ncbi:MAG: type II toxin-antitoxin system prevent-host-death family antitoxin [SAR202 cluster bacterium]|nr:type II toxin-antitoxin system prevent-host-death family antitoxin [SAR202 cluster bacterium]
MEKTITATELARELSEILNKVKYKGERYTVTRNGMPIATIGPATPPKSVTFRELMGSLKKVPWPDEDFAKDLREIQKRQSKSEPPSWPS